MNLRPLIVAATILLLTSCATGDLIEEPPESYPRMGQTDPCWKDMTVPVQPQMPKQALEQRKPGWVLVPYTLDGSGHASHIVVEASRPTGLFDAETLLAVNNTEFAAGVTKAQCKSLYIFKHVR